MADRRRKRVLNVRIDDAEAAMLDALADRDGITVSDWVRLAVRRAYRDAFGEGKPRRKKRKR